MNVVPPRAVGSWTAGDQRFKSRKLYKFGICEIKLATQPLPYILSLDQPSSEAIPAFRVVLLQ